MALAVDDIWQAIIDSVGDVDPTTGDTPTDPDSGAISLGIETWWELYASKDLVGPGLRAAYTRRDAIRRVMAILAQRRFDVADNLSGLSIRAGQIYRHYQDMLDGSKDEIKALEASATGGGNPATGRITTTLVPAPADRVQQYVDTYSTAYKAALEG